MDVPGKTAHKSFASSMKSLGSSEDYEIYCQPCDRNGPRLPAYGFCTDCKEHLCESCFKHHKRHTLSMHHNLLDKNNMPQTMQLSSAPVHTRQLDNLTTPCQKHTKEVIKFFCHDHKALLCNACVTLEHTGTTCKVNYIPDIAGQIIDSKEYKDILKDIDTITDQCNKMSEDLKKLTAKSNSSLADVLISIKKFRKEINQRLDVLERQVENAAKAIQLENDKNFKSVATTCDDVTKSLKISADSIKHLNTSKQADRLFMELKLAEQMIKDYEKSVQQASTYDVKEYNFNSNNTISTFLKTQKSLGSLAQTTIETKICVSTPKDKNMCRITGMTLLPKNHLIIVDSSNKAIKIMDTHSHFITDQLQLDFSPLDVTAVTSTELAVTLPWIEKIQFVSAISNNLAKKQTLNTDGKCSGISYYQGKLVVSFEDLSKLQILNTNGTVLKTVQANFLSNIFGTTIFRKPCYVKCSQNGIYISDSELKRVVRLNWECEMIGNYGGMSMPNGISVSDDGSVFVCDSVRYVIEKISGDFSTGKVVLKSLKDPHAVCWCAETSTLYVSCDSWNDQTSNFIRRFSIHSFK
ncbi:uncharacterized protein LOC128556349 [Mercenaria mercenaria]|uniref:uncharacterized protein LOC128556349 n=1 Tax=Mercenaria mercenaria TaxID=6596 RepID=UPI00234F933B|nr:uncharacterized protein LOC128556349 [Mercenaria mercenaria]XP_053397063.1 uncharacterized protein LOC128556349 [Mercenaria mercenaria]